MASKEIALTLRLPWWSSLYVWALLLSELAGVLVIDEEVAASVIVQHSKVIERKRV